MPEEIKITENNFICKTLFHLNTIRGFHWQTESYVEHQVLDEYQNKLTELVDKFVETLKEFRPITDAGYIEPYIDKSDVIQHIKEYQEKIRDIRATLNVVKKEKVEVNDLLSIIDDFEQTTNEALFHLRLK